MKIVKHLAILSLSIFAIPFFFAKTSHAASLDSFDPGYIMSDYVMSNKDSMSEADIQAFLSSKNSCGNTDYGYYLSLSNSNPNIKWHFENGHFICLSEERFGDGEVIGTGDSAAHIIYEAAQDYNINPAALIVLLQKESSLITDPIPNNSDYRKATGFGCPDTAPCSAEYYGFKNQIRRAASLFHTVLTGGWTNYPLGDNYIQYNPDPGCGGSVVNIRSLATSALYRYTPYQPNAGAISAGYGTAPCGAYGNRNFFLYYSDWFGNPMEEQPKETNVLPKPENLPSFETLAGTIDIIPEENSDADLSYESYIYHYQWTGVKKGGQMSGTTGLSVPMEAIKINSKDVSLSYRTHVQNIGWQDWVKNGETAGTTEGDLRLEALEIKLSENDSKQYDIYYRTHVQNIGWQDWVKNGETAGTTGQSLRVEAIQIKIIAKELPELNISYRTHVQNIGWQDWVAAGELAGTTGKSLRMEAIEIKLPENVPTSAISYRAHVENIGWQDWVAAGELAGTTGKSLRMEAIEIKLSEKYSQKYQLQYRAHVENIGWQDWVAAGELAGTTGKSLRLEAVEVRLVQKQ